MGKRIYEIAKEYGKQSKDVLELLKKNNIEKTNFSTADEKDIAIIKNAYEKKEAPKAAPQKEAPKAGGMVVKKIIPATTPVKRIVPAPSATPVARTADGRVQQNNNYNRNNNGQQGNRQGGERCDNNDRNERREGGQGFNRNNGQQGNRQGGFNGERREGNRNNGQQGNRQGGFNGERRERNDRNGQGGFNGERRERSDRNGQGGFNGERREGGRPQGGQGPRPQGGQGGFRKNNGPMGGAGFNSGDKDSGERTNTRVSGQGRDTSRRGASNKGQGGIFVGPNAVQPQTGHQETRAQANRSKDKDYEKKNKRSEKGGSVKGSYATKESRPNRSAGHQMNYNKKPLNNPKAPQAEVEIVRPTFVEVGESINVQEFAKLIKREVAEVIKALFLLGMMVTINQDIDFETAQLIGDNFGVEVGQKAPEEDPTELPEVEDPEELRVGRPPVITVMGHVDHGKTSLLDAIRKTNVTAREAGGITQHIGAYKVNYQGNPIVFLDTPGHEAFTAMRARGAQVTDVAILVVAADDGVMPQTIEAINHAKAAKVPVIVAINKMDRLGANPDHVKQQLSEHGLIPEDWGGDTIMVPVSAHTKEGIPELLEMILLQAEMQDLKANPDLPAHGTIVEAQLDKGRGPVATVLVQRGTLQVGDSIIAGTCYGKVRAMVNDRGEKVKKATPSMPVEVLGLNDVPNAGDILDSADEKTCRGVAEKRLAKKKEEEIAQNSKVSLDDLFKRIQEGEIKDLNIVVKADVQGTIEALKASLEKIKNEEVKVVVVHSGVGAITESDVMLASAANALIIGFNVRPDANARKAAEAEKIDMRTYRVIYDALNDVEAAIKGMLAPKFEEVIQGRVEVRQVITISKMRIAGCYVLEGKITNNSKVRIIRDNIELHEDAVDSLRRFKDDVKEVNQGYECGLTLEKYSADLREGDIFEVYSMEEVAVE